MKDSCIKSVLVTLCLLAAGAAVPALPAMAAQSPASANTIDDAGGSDEHLRRDDGFIEIWEDLTPKLEQILDLEENHDHLPERAIWGADKPSNRRNINELLDEAITTLALPGGTDYRQRIRELETSIRTLQDQIAGYRQSQVSAPREAYWRNTVEDYDAMIRESQQRIGDMQQRIQMIKQ
jgi:hypothetical protein